jgi:hypothetical protein
MTHKPLIIAAAGALALVLAWPAQAMTLTNRDATDLMVKITDSGDGADQDLLLAANETIEDVCENGCTLILEDGQQADFNGDEDVYIEGGRFIIAE